MSKYHFPNLKSFFATKGIKIREFLDGAFKAEGRSVASSRSWTHALNGHGVGETMINKMQRVAMETLRQMGHEVANDTLKYELVSE